MQCEASLRADSMTRNYDLRNIGFSALWLHWLRFFLGQHELGWTKPRMKRSAEIVEATPFGWICGPESIHMMHLGEINQVVLVSPCCSHLFCRKQMETGHQTENPTLSSNLVKSCHKKIRRYISISRGLSLPQYIYMYNMYHSILCHILVERS